MIAAGYATIPPVPAIQINLDARWRRWLLLVPAALIVASAYFITRWYLGNTLAQYAPTVEIAQLAGQLAPADPQTHFTLAVFSEQNLSLEDLTHAVVEYERAAALSPSDYRLWQALGRARGHAGDTAGSEQALRYAIELAPFYANPRWLLGNLLLRQGRESEAFAELRRAGEALPTLRPHIFSLAWSLYKGNPPQIIAALGDTPATQTELIKELLRHQRVDEGLVLWAAFGSDQKREHAQTGEALRQALFKLNRFHDAWRVSQEIAPEGAENNALFQIANGGFERDVSLSVQDLFGWQVAQAAEPVIKIDRGHAHGGGRSLQLTFNSSTGRDFRSVSQLVPVEAKAAYRLVYYVRTEELKSASTLVVEVVAAGDNSQTLASSTPLTPGTNEWQPVTLDFNTPPQAEAVTVQLARVPCPDAVCPIFGNVWYDDFNLQRLTGSTGDVRGSAQREKTAKSR